ncbi:hypothetical protein BKA70DRAFT_1124785 [Coprinopsis sp. MPI-PUGE-AT-0042]|nr:hypothetical protein BKA70DRAFT_1124785 [Coprinopsis sp. MPI-PUGE-AT-0042]
MATSSRNGPNSLGDLGTQSHSTRKRNRNSRDSDDSGSDSEVGYGRSSALTSGPKKRPTQRSPLVHHGRHFGRTIQAFCRVQTLIKNGMVRTVQLHTGELEESDLSRSKYRERREHDIYQQLLRLSPSLEDKLCNGNEDDIFQAAELITKGASSARADDTKGLKGVIIDWITPPGVALSPPLSRNVKTDRGFFHDATGRLLCPMGLDWSVSNIRDGLRTGRIPVKGDQWAPFLYKDYKIYREDVWRGLFRSQLLISAFKHIFTSPSSVYWEARATRSGNARIHGMTSVTIPSLAYVATQVRFALSSSPVFSKTDLVTDSETFYTSVIETFSRNDEKEEVDKLLEWWNRQIFPRQATETEDYKQGSVLALMKERRRKKARLSSEPSSHEDTSPSC